MEFPLLHGREQGAILVENLEIANLEDIRDFTSSGEFVAMLAEFKIALNAYLGDLVKSPVRTLGQVIAFNKNNSYLVSVCLQFFVVASIF